MNFLKRNLLKILSISLFSITPILSFAQGTISGVPCEKSGKLCNPIPYNTLGEFIKVVLTGAIKLGIPLIVIMIVYSGFLFVSAQGNPESLKKAKDSLLYTLIGAAVLLGALAIAQLIAHTVTGLNPN